MRAHFQKAMLLVLVISGFLLTGCGGSSSSKGDDKKSSAAPTTYTFTYTMTASPAEFATGRYVAVVDQPTTGDSTCNIASAAIVRSEVAVTSAGSAAVTLNLPISTFKDYYLETIYVDVDSNHVLNNGDLDMGTSGALFDAFCNQVGTDNMSFTFNWDALQASAFGGGPSTWTGGTQTYSLESGISAQPAGIAVPNLNSLEGVTPSDSN